MIALSPPEQGVTRVHMWTRVGKAFRFTVSAYFVDGILVDTGFPRAAPELASLLDNLAVRGAIITHSHEDHAGNAALLGQRGIPLAGGAETMAALHRRPDLHLPRRLIWGTPRLPESIEPFGDDRFQLLPAPGHSADHHVIWDAERGHLFGGDLFLGVKVRVAHEGEDPRTLLSTLRRVVALEPTLLFDAHRGIVREPIPLLTAKADWLEETIDAMDRLAAEGAEEREISRRVLGPEGWLARGSRGEYSALNFVRAVHAARQQPPARPIR